MIVPLIFDIKRGSLEDGPGVRTTIFFKGCNLNCFWCHNPESKKSFVQTAYFEEKCVGCGECKNIENDLGKAEVCKEHARKIYGKEYTVAQLVEIALKDKCYYDVTDGGVTLSGGECMLYPDFVAELSKMLKEKGIGVFIDTAGNVAYKEFEKVLPYVDGFLYDIKCLDEKIHISGTGASNSLILENFYKLIKTDKKIIVRIPEIPNFNEGKEKDKVVKLCKNLGIECEVLEYHEYGISKQKSLK